MTDLPAMALTVSPDAASALGELARTIASWRKDRSRKTVPHAPVGDPTGWTQLADAGWPQFGITLDGERPTAGADLLALAELCGAELLAVPLVSTVGALRHLARLDADAAARRDAHRPASLALPAPGGRLTAAFAAGADVLLPGTLRAPAFASATHGVDLATDDYAATLPLADLAAPPGVGVDAAAREQGVREIALMYASTTVGCAARCLERSVAYSRERQAYGAPIGSYQALRHMMADMYRDVELARSGLVGALVEPDWLAIALYVTDGAQQVVARAIQIHGGIGFTWDAGLHFHARHILAVRKVLMRLRDA